MEKSEFYKIVNKLILPLFIGSFIDGEEESSPRDSEVAFGKRSSLLIKPSKTDECRLVLKRGQPFQAFEINLLKNVLNEIDKISKLNIEDENYISVLQNNAIEREDVVSDLECLGIELDKEVNNISSGKEVKISKDSSKIGIYVIPTNEELEIAKQTREIVSKC